MSLDALQAAMRREREQLDVTGLCWGVSVGGQQTYGAAGLLDPHRPDRPMPLDGIFRIASVTKPVLAIAVLRAVDAGLTALEEPVESVLPELADRRVLQDPQGDIDGPTEPARRPLTVEDLLTFRCGLGMDFDHSRPQPVLERMNDLGIGVGPVAPGGTPEEFLDHLHRLPLSDHPGEKWRYHTGSDILSVYLERLHDSTLDAVLKQGVLGPLGMSDTGFWVPQAARGRFGVCRMQNDGEPTVWDEPEGRWAHPPQFRSGGTGLVSTVKDLLALGEMLLRQGQGPDGGRILERDTCAAMLTDHLTDGQRAAAKLEGEGDGLGWGLGIGVRHRAAEGGWPPAGSYGWDGGLGSRFLVDPEREVCTVVLGTEAWGTPGGEPLLGAFTEHLRTALAGQ